MPVIFFTLVWAAAFDSSVWVTISITLISGVLWMAYRHPAAYARVAPWLALTTVLLASCWFIYGMGFSFW